MIIICALEEGIIQEFFFFLSVCLSRYCKMMAATLDVKLKVFLFEFGTNICSKIMLGFIFVQMS